MSDITSPPRVRRAAVVATAALTVSAAYVGAWASAAPRSFYDPFPGLHRVWISVDGPFNEHLVRDVGGFYLGFAAAGILALWWRQDALFALLGVAWTVFSALHLAYHATHTSGYDDVDAVGQVGALGLTLLGAVVLVAVSMPTRRSARSAGGAR